MKTLKVLIVVLIVVFFLFGCIPSPGQDDKEPVYWVRSYGGSSDDKAESIQQTKDGGFIVAGSTKSFGEGNNDAWILKLDKAGEVSWQKTYGGSLDDSMNSIQQTADGGYITAGLTSSFGGNWSDIWILKLDADGNIIWQKKYNVTIYSIQQTTDSGYITSGSNVMKLDSNGNVTWRKCHSPILSGCYSSVQQTSDGGYIAAGFVSWKGFFPSYSIIKFDNSGNKLWEKRYYGEMVNWNHAYDIKETMDNGFIITGCRKAEDTAGGYDGSILKIDIDGNVVWQKTYGGSLDDSMHSIQQTPEGGYIAVGSTESYGAGSSDLWILRLCKDGLSYYGVSTNIASSDSDAAIEDANPIVDVIATVVTDTTITPMNTEAVVNIQYEQY